MMRTGTEFVSRSSLLFQEAAVDSMHTGTRKNHLKPNSEAAARTAAALVSPKEKSAQAMRNHAHLLSLVG